MGLILRNKNEDIKKYMNKRELLKVVYGITFAEDFLEETGMKPDYFCDVKAERENLSVNGIQVITKEKLKDILETQNKRALILICAGPDKRIVNSIYKDLCMLDMNADVFDYFANEMVFTDRTFTYKGVTLDLYEHIFNDGFCDTRMTERSVELSLARNYLEKCEGEIVEVGAVTPYYQADCFGKVKHIIDPTDRHIKVDIRKSLFDCNFEGQDVISISTLEHVGTGDFNFQEKHDAVEAVNKILNEAKTCLITVPTGYNQMLDEWLIHHKYDKEIRIIKRNCNNKWNEVIPDDFNGIRYTKYWANGLAVIEKSGEGT